MSGLLAKIDALIDRAFMPKTCRRRSRCKCGHIDDMHERIHESYRANRGRCAGRGCNCTWFVAYSYEKEREQLRAKLRAFAFDVIRESGDVNGVCLGVARGPDGDAGVGVLDSRRG